MCASVIRTLTSNCFRVVRRLVSWQTFACPGQEIPVTVTFAQVRRWLVDHRVLDARSRPLDDRSQMRPGRSVRKHGEIQRHARTDDVEHADREQTDTSALVEEREVKTAARHRNAARLRVDVCAVQLGKYPISGDDVDVTVGAFVPCRSVRVSEVVV